MWWWGVPSTEVHRHMQITETSREAAVLALFWVSEDGPHVLLTERSPELAKHPGQIAFPGGGAEESDADLPGTALREAHEETGLDLTERLCSAHCRWRLSWPVASTSHP